MNTDFDILFISNGPWNKKIELYFAKLKQKYNDIKRIHGLSYVKICSILPKICDKKHCLLINANKANVSALSLTQLQHSYDIVDVLKCKYNELPFHPTNKPDIVYLTYKERQAETSFKHLLKKYPNLKRLHGIKGLCNAFRCSAEIVESDYYILIDGDNQVLDSFDLYSLSRPTQNTMSFCKTRNPVNDLIYGYGGIKSCPTENFRSISDDKLDPIASGGIQKGHCIPVVASITAFNTSPFNAWKAGFRESVMLLNQDNEISMNHDEIMHKLAVWQTTGKDRKFGTYAIQGALDGEQYGRKFHGIHKELFKINDPQFLYHMFMSSIHKKSSKQR